MATTLETPFAKALAVNIRAKVAELKADRTVGMHPDNLMMLVRTPSVTKGAPLGTNARYYYKQLFREVLASMSFKGFEIIAD